LPANTEQLAEVSSEADAAAAAAAAAQASATAANATAASAVTTANSAASSAAAAQSAAATANATAIAANTAAGVAQTTANGKNTSTYSTSAPGSTPNTLGDIWFQYGTSAPNVGRIIAQFTGNGGTSWTPTTISGLVIANIDAGNITTGTLTAAVGISNPSGNFSVNGATGALIATGATITGAVNALSGYFGTLTNGFSISSTGLVGVGTGTIVGGVISGAQFTNGSTFSVSPTGFLIAESGTIGGSTLASGSITGGTIQTSTGSASVSLVGSSNSVTFKNGGSNVGHIVPLSSNGVIMHYGATADGSGGTFPQMFVGSANASMFASSTVGIGVATGTGVSINGTTSLNNQTNYPGIATASGSTVVVVTTGSRLGFVSSSRKTKKNIEPLTGNFVSKLLSLEPVSFDWKDQPEDMPYRRNYGLIAEDVASLTNEMESIVNYNQDNEAVSISYDRLTVFLMLAIKELKAEIDQLKGE
jgi:hypothetical protein